MYCKIAFGGLASWHAQDREGNPHSRGPAHGSGGWGVWEVWSSDRVGEKETNLMVGHTEPSGLHSSLWLDLSAGICVVPSTSSILHPLSLLILLGSPEPKGRKEQAFVAAAAWSKRGPGEACGSLPVQEVIYQCVSPSQGPTSIWLWPPSGRVWDTVMIHS